MPVTVIYKFLFSSNTEKENHLKFPVQAKTVLFSFAGELADVVNSLPSKLSLHDKQISKI